MSAQGALRVYAAQCRHEPVPWPSRCLRQTTPLRLPIPLLPSRLAGSRCLTTPTSGQHQCSRQRSRNSKCSSSFELELALGFKANLVSGFRMLPMTSIIRLSQLPFRSAFHPQVRTNELCMFRNAASIRFARAATDQNGQLCQHACMDSFSKTLFGRPSAQA